MIDTAKVDKARKRNKVSRWYFCGIGVAIGLCGVVLLFAGQDGLGLGALGCGLASLAVYSVYEHEHKYHGE